MGRGGGWEAGRGWGVGREEAKAPQVKTRGHEVLSCPQMVPTIQPGRRDIIPVKGGIPGR